MSLTNLIGYSDILATSAVLEGINTSEFVVRNGKFPNTNLLTCDTKNLIVNINGTLDVSTFGISSIPNSIISTNSSGVFEALSIGSNLAFSSNTLSTVASPTFTNITGTLLTAAQPNITSLGTLTSLSVSGSLLLSNQTANALLYSNGSEIVSSGSINNPLTFTSGSLGLSYNNSNLKLTSNALNTIQDITTTASPTFSALTITNAVGCGSLNVGGNAIITGNLTVNGTTTTVNSTTVSVETNFLQLANANSSTNSLDIGFYGEYYASSAVRYTGLFYKSSNLGYQLYENLTVQPGSTVTTTDASYQLAALSIAALNATTGNFSGNLTTNVASSVLSTNASGIIQALSVGNGLSLSSNTLTASINNTNLQFTSGQINTSQGISTTASPQFTALTLSGLTASTPIYANASKVLTSGSYGNGLSFNTSTGALVTNIDGTNLIYSSGTITTSQALQTSSSPTFTGLNLSGLTANSPIYSNSFKILSSGSYGNGLSWSGGNLSTKIDGSNLVYSGSTITTAQGITTSSTPTFAGLTSTSNITLPNNEGGSTYKLELAAGDGNHYLYSTGSGGNSTYFGEYLGKFNFYDTCNSYNVFSINGKAVTTYNNTLDDGSGNTTVSYLTSAGILVTNSTSSVNSALSSSNGSYLTIESFNAGNTTKYPVCLAPYGGSVGVGTVSPSYTLDVSGSTRVTGNSTVDGSIYISCADGSFSNTTSALDLYHVTGYYRIGFDSGGGVGYIRHNIIANSATNTWGHCFGTSLSGSINTFTNTLFVGASGNVGIGTTSPGYLLDVYSATTPASATTVDLARFYTNAVGTNATTTYGRVNLLVNGNYGGYISGYNLSGTGGGLTFGINQANSYSEALRIATSGNVGIGTTSPGNKLQINTINYGDTALSFNYNTAPGTLGSSLHLGPYLDLYTPDYYGNSYKAAQICAGNQPIGGRTNGGVLQFLVSQGDGGPAPSAVMTLANDGCVGIGTTSPGYLLDVYSAANPSSPGYVDTARFYAGYASSGTTYSRVNIVSGTYGGYIAGFLTQDIGGGLTLGRNNGGPYTEVIRIDTTNNVGIGTTSPATTLQTAGVCSANSFACYSGTTANTNQLFGYQAGNQISSGAKNTCVGYQAGSNLTTGTECVTIGYGANVSTAAATNRTAIGYNASATADNSTFITNIYGNSGGGYGQFVTVNNNNQLGSVGPSYIGGSYIGSYSLFSANPGTGTTTLITITATIPSYGSSWRISGSYYFAVNGNSNGPTSFQTYLTATSSSNFAASENLLINNDSYGMSGSGYTTCPYSPGASVTVTLQCVSASQPVFIQTSAYNCSSYVQLIAIQSS